VAEVNTEATLRRRPSAGIGRLDEQQSSLQGMSAPAYLDSPVEGAEEARQVGRRMSILYAVIAGSEGA
jgi:hypothetical protein